jgi:hypothetical protein
MPSAIHEALVELFRDQPSLAQAVFGLTAGKSFAPTRASVTSAQFSDISPPTYASDVVIEHADDCGDVIRVFVVEVQRDRSPDKRFAPARRLRPTVTPTFSSLGWEYVRHMATPGIRKLWFYPYN